MAEFVAIVVFGSLAMMWLYRHRARKEQNDPLRRFRERQCQWTTRLREPDFEAFRRRFGCEPPPVLKSLYQNHPALTWSECIVAPSTGAGAASICHVASILPCDAEELDEVTLGFETYFAFAADWKWDVYLIDPKKLDPSVLLHDSTAGRQTLVCDRLSDFLAWKVVSRR